MINEKNNVEIIGTGSYAPERIVTNDELSQIMDTSHEWIKSRTGICERRISEGENTSDIAIKASNKAIEDADIDVSDIDLIICATITPDYFTPSTACIIQSAIGAHNAVCFDISAACTGFIYSLSIAEKFIRSGQYSCALVIGVETLSKIIDWKDRNTSVLFGDGGGAAILRKSREEGLLGFYLGSNGSKGKALTCAAVPVSNFLIGKRESSQTVSMDGKEIFKFAVRTMSDTILKLTKDMNISKDDIKCVIPHQANLRIIETASSRLNIPIEKFYINLDKYGNTSAGSIPIALDEVNKKGIVKKGDKILLVGFGGGLTFGGGIVEWTMGN